MDKCEVCSKEWQERYNLAVKRFDKSLNLAMTITIVSICVALTSIILTAICVSKTLNFINEFEYVEETIVEQDGNGQNVAVIVNDRKGG